MQQPELCWVHGPRKSQGTCPPTTSRWVHVPHKNRAGYMSPAKLAPGTCPPTAGTRVPHATSQPTVLGASHLKRRWCEYAVHSLCQFCILSVKLFDLIFSLSRSVNDDFFCRSNDVEHADLFCRRQKRRTKTCALGVCGLQTAGAVKARGRGTCTPTRGGHVPEK